MAKTRASYGAEFRAGAVRIVTETGETAAQVARDLGVHEATLQNWVNRARSEAGRAGNLAETERAELRRLREENKRLRKGVAEVGMERDVLKRSVVLWVKEATR